MRRFLHSALAALAALAAAGPARAVDKLVNTPAEKFVTAPGGVDLRTGRFVYEENDLRIGGEGNSGLSLSRTLTATVPGHANPFGNLSHNWDIMVSERRFSVDSPEATSGPDFQINVHFGGRSMTYVSRYNTIGYQQASPGTWAPLTFTGDRAGAAVYTYTATDGTVAVFRPIAAGECSTSRRCAYVSEITEVDGTRFTFSYVPAGAGVRLARVTSSRGFALLFEGSGTLVTKACVVNLASAPAPAGGLCPAGAPTATYSYVDGRIVAATGPENATAQFTYGTAPYQNQANGSTTMGFVKPGYATPWLTNRSHVRLDEIGVPQDIVDQQSYADGQSYTYEYQLSPWLSYKEQTLAGGSYVDALGGGGSAVFDWPIAPGANYPGSTCTRLPCPIPGPDGPTDDPSFVYQQTPGPVSITAQGGTTGFQFCDAAAMAGLPANERNRCVVDPVAQYIVDPEGIRTDLKYDNNYNVIEAKRSPKPGALDPDGTVPAPIVTSATYVTTLSRSANKPLSMTDARGNTTRWTYAPEHGGVLTETGPAVNGVTPQKRYFYVQRQARLSDGSAAGPPVWLLDSLSTCRMGNPASGGGCALGGADEVLTRYDYGPDSGPTNLLLRGQAVTADGITLRTCYGYDGLGRKVSETSPNAALAACSGVSPAGAAPYTRFTRYDPGNQVTGTIAPDPDGPGGLGAPAVRNSYDAAGRLVRVEEGALAAWQPESVAPTNWPGFTIHKTIDTAWDALDRKTREAVSGGGVTASVTEYGYDVGGRLECTAVRMNPDAWSVPLADPCVPGPASATFGADRISKNVYDSAGRLVQSKDGVGTPLERAEATWTYNANGQKTSLTDARGYRAEMSYDGFGRQRRWTFPSKTATGTADQTDYEEYGYDAAGNRTSLRKRDGSALAFQYDALNRVTVKTVPEGSWLDPVHTRDVYYSYDNRGLQTAARFDSLAGEGVTTRYDGFGRVASSTVTMAGTSRTVSHLYDRDGDRIRITHPDGAFFDYDYDPLNRLVGIRENGGDRLAGFTYDGAGRELGRAYNAGASKTAFGYDPAGRLTGLAHDLAGPWGDQSIGLAYNPASQIVGRTGSNDAYAWTGAYAANRGYTVNGLNQYMSAGPATFQYDPKGNLISDGSTFFTYDIENRLVLASGGKNAALLYDPLGRLFQVSGGPAGITRFVYDDDALVAEYDSAGTMLRRYIHGGDKGADDPLVWYDNVTAGWRRALHADQQGSIVAVADMSGNALAINTYDEYGIPGANNTGRFQYTGQAWIPELGMYYYKARIYSPTLGRFLQVDPIGYEGGINLYGYVGGDPINRTDSTGKCFWDLCVGEAYVGVAVVAGVASGVCYATGACQKFSDAVRQGVDLLIQGTRHASSSSRPETSKRPPGADGKRGSTGGKGSGKRFPAEKPDVKAGKEGVPCGYCGMPTTNQPGRPDSRERDHIDPRSRGGNYTPENERDSCRTCNRSKGNRSPDEWEPRR